MSTIAEQLSDPELLETEWNLAPLVDGDGEPGVDRLLDEATELAEAFARANAGKVAELDASGLEAAMRQLERIDELIGRAGSYAALQFATDTADPARGALLQRVQERATAVETKLLFFELEWAAVDEARAEQLLRRRRTGVLPPPPPQRPPLSPPPADRARREDPRGEVDLEPERLEPPVRGARRGVAREPRSGGVDARCRAQSPTRSRPRRETPRRRGDHQRARARRAHARVHLQHARPRQGGRGPPAQLSSLARRSQPCQRGLG